MIRDVGVVDLDLALEYSERLHRDDAPHRPGKGERDFCIDNLLVRIHYTIQMIRGVGVVNLDFALEDSERLHRDDAPHRPDPKPRS